MRQEAKGLIVMYIVVLIATLVVCTFILGLWG